MRFGFACISTLRPDISCQRGTILKNATPARLDALARENITGLYAMLDHVAGLGLGLFRIGESFIPFASHPEVGYDWRAALANDLAAVGDYARQRGIRLSFHPGPYTVPNSTRPDVVRQAVRDLDYQAGVLDLLGQSADAKVIVHGGGGQPTKQEAAARFAATINDLPDALRRRLVIENDERLWGVDDALALSRATGAPVVFDAFHHRVYPGPKSDDLDAVLRAVFDTWPVDQTPKIHFSSQAPDRRPGAHADHIDPDEFGAFLDAVSGVGRDFDVMFEAKAKDAAVVRLLSTLNKQTQRQEVPSPWRLPFPTQPALDRTRVRGYTRLKG